MSYNLVLIPGVEIDDFIYIYCKTITKRKLVKISITSNNYHLCVWVCAHVRHYEGFPNASVAKNLPANAGDTDVGSIPELGRSPGRGNGNLL